MITLNRHDPGAGGNAAADTGDAHNLARRVASALVLAPIAIVGAYFGGWLFVLLCAIAAGIILWEWASLVAGGGDLRILLPGVAALLAATVMAGAGLLGAAIAMVAVGAALAGGFVAAWPRRYPAANPALWGAAGVVYAGAALIGPTVLRGDPELGFAALLFLFATVWATDVFAYLAGRAIGGPLLCPGLSPNKTWAGAIGGLAGGVAAGTLVAYASVGTEPAVAGVLALVLSISAQGGDLLESAIKRRFGAKDSERPHSRTWRRDGPSRRLSGRRFAGCRDRFGASGSGGVRTGSLGMVVPSLGRSMKQKRTAAKVELPQVDPARLPRTVTLLGATGSIGSSTADLLRRDAARYQVEAVTAHREAGALARLARELNARFAVVADPAAYGELKAELSGSGIAAAAGAAAVVEAAQRPADWVMAAITGAASLAPTLAAAERGATVALANKECLVCAGALFMRRAAASGATVLPVDSEHNAIFQALERRPARGSPAHRAHRLGRAVSHLAARSDP